MNRKIWECICRLWKGQHSLEHVTMQFISNMIHYHLRTLSWFQVSWFDILSFFLLHSVGNYMKLLIWLKYISFCLDNKFYILIDWYANHILTLRPIRTLIQEAANVLEIIRSLGGMTWLQSCDGSVIVRKLCLILKNC